MIIWSGYIATLNHTVGPPRVTINLASPKPARSHKISSVRLPTCCQLWFLFGGCLYMWRPRVPSPCFVRDYLCTNVLAIFLYFHCGFQISDWSTQVCGIFEIHHFLLLVPHFLSSILPLLLHSRHPLSIGVIIVKIWDNSCVFLDIPHSLLFDGGSTFFLLFLTSQVHSYSK